MDVISSAGTSLTFILRPLPGIIMEFKATKNDAGLYVSADEALKQIEDKHYDTDMKDRGIREIVKYGIAFAGKNVEIAIG